MKQIKWLGQAAISDACLAACEKVHGAKSGKPDPIALLACVAANCSGGQPPATMPPPGLTLPAGMVLPGGLTLPPGFPLPAGQLPPGALPPGLPTSIIPPGFQLPSSWTLPSNWTLPTALTIPPGTPLPPNLPTVPPPAQTAPPPQTPTTPASVTEKKDNTVLWVVGGLAAVAAVALVVSASKGGGSLSANPKGGAGLGENPRNPRPRSGYAYETSVPVNRSWIDTPNDDWDTVVISPSRNYEYVGKRSIDGSMVYVWHRKGTRIHIAQIAFG